MRLHAQAHTCVHVHMNVHPCTQVGAVLGVAGFELFAPDRFMPACSSTAAAGNTDPEVSVAAAGDGISSEDELSRRCVGTSRVGMVMVACLGHQCDRYRLGNLIGICLVCNGRGLACGKYTFVIAIGLHRTSG